MGRSPVAKFRLPTSLSIDDWERQWRSRLIKAGAPGYELPMESDELERDFLTKPSTIEKETERFKRIQPEFVRGFRTLHTQVPQVPASKGSFSASRNRTATVGCQGRGSLCRKLVDGRSPVTIHGEKVMVRAEVNTMSSFIALAGKKDLRAWFGAIAPSRPQVVLPPGEDGPRRELAGLILRRFKLRSLLPKMGDVVEL